MLQEVGTGRPTGQGFRSSRPKVLRNVLAEARAEDDRCLPTGRSRSWIRLLGPYRREAQRLGLDALAGDMNPVGCARVALEIPSHSRRGPPVLPRPVVCTVLLDGARLRGGWRRAERARRVGYGARAWLADRS